jgi:hypothetical protein
MQREKAVCVASFCTEVRGCQSANAFDIDFGVPGPAICVLFLAWCGASSHFVDERLVAVFVGVVDLHNVARVLYRIRRRWYAVVQN